MNNKSVFILLWIAALIIELFALSGLIHRVHDQDEVLLYFAVILVTLVVGAVLALISNSSAYKRGNSLFKE